MSDVEAQARERVLKRYGPEVLEQLTFWERETLVLMEEVKLENEAKQDSSHTAVSSS